MIEQKRYTHRKVQNISLELDDKWHRFQVVIHINPNVINIHICCNSMTRQSPNKSTANMKDNGFINYKLSNRFNTVFYIANKPTNLSNAWLVFCVFLYKLVLIKLGSFSSCKDSSALDLKVNYAYQSMNIHIERLEKEQKNLHRSNWTCLRK